MTNIALLMPFRGTPPPPCSVPLGRAALAVREEGIQVVFADRVHGGVFDGFVATDAGWKPIKCTAVAAIDRFGSFTDPQGYAKLLAELCGTPLLNPPVLTALLRDKILSQHALHDLHMPAICVDPRHFERFLSAGPAFVKPRFGSFGRGVARVTTAPAARDLVDGVNQPLFLQRAIPPPAGYAGVSLRILAQRIGSQIIIYPPVARVHRTDAVVNRARGAQVVPCIDRFPIAERPALALARAVIERLPHAIEVGVDAVLDPELRPHLIEVNARPRGRLSALAAAHPERFAEAHLQACCGPFRAVVALLAH